VLIRSLAEWLLGFAGVALFAMDAHKPVNHIGKKPSRIIYVLGERICNCQTELFVSGRIDDRSAYTLLDVFAGHFSNYESEAT
jgi:hypothetical protein